MLLSRSAIVWTVGVCLAPLACSRPAAMGGEVVHSGMSDASAAVALDANTILVADDETNTLCAFRAGQPGPPLWRVDLGESLAVGVDNEHPEADIEGAAALDGRVYWITSHGRNREGKWRPNRHRFFAVTVRAAGGTVAVKPFGRTRADLAAYLLADERLARLGLSVVLRPEVKQDTTLAPKREGMNIEALAATADGKGLLMGFRNPLIDGKALLVPLRNPEEFVARGAAPQLGEPILLELTGTFHGRPIGLGVRGMTWSPRHGAYLILGGPSDERKAFALFRWSGREGDRPVLLGGPTRAIAAIDDFTPESIVAWPAADRVLLISDDGSRKVKVSSPAECRQGTFIRGTCENKYLTDQTKKTFRSLWVEPD